MKPAPQSNSMLHTTLALLKAHSACARGYRKLVRHLGGSRKWGLHRPIPLTTVLESNGLIDAVWCLQATLLEEKTWRDTLARLFAADCAEHVLHLHRLQRKIEGMPAQTIRIARQFAFELTSTAELNHARETAFIVFHSSKATTGAFIVPAVAAYTAFADATDAAYAVATATDTDDELPWQADCFRAWLEGTRTVEEVRQELAVTQEKGERA